MAAGFSSGGGAPGALTSVREKKKRRDHGKKNPLSLLILSKLEKQKHDPSLAAKGIVFSRIHQDKEGAFHANAGGPWQLKKNGT